LRFTTKRLIPLNILRSSAGFTYIAALAMVVIMGIMLGVASQSWTMIMKRERETELLFRGKQIVDAIARWHNRGNQAGSINLQSRPINDLKDLLQDPGSVSKQRYLRKDPTKIWNDPITGKDWEVLRDNARGGVYGVRSTSEEKPLRQSGFLELFYPLDPVRDKYLVTMLQGFEKKSKYKDWVFAYTP
jgi:type II secretory pathway pseudopilin PulG